MEEIKNFPTPPVNEEEIPQTEDGQEKAKIISNTRAYKSPNSINSFLLVIIALLIGLAGFLGWQNYRLLTTTEPIPSTTPTTQSSPSPSPQLPSNTESFQTTLTNNCQTIDFENGFNKKINITHLPFTINESTLSDFYGDDSLYCAGPPDLGMWLSIAPDDYGHMNIYNEQSNELGHGGINFIKPFSRIFKEINGITYSLSLDFPDGGCKNIEEYNLIVRADKLIETPSNEDLYVSADIIALKKGNARLTEILSNFSQPCSFDENMTELKPPYNLALDEIAEILFGDWNNLTSHEQQTIQDITKKVNSVQPK